MNEILYSKLLQESDNKKEFAKQFTKRRYLYQEINKIKSKYHIGVYGLRGIGKTIMLLQLSLEHKDSIYFSADATYLTGIKLYEIVNFLEKKGHKMIYVDEIAHKDNWKIDLKTISDENKVIIYFTSSSAIDIQTGVDLSRRVLLFELKAASFREYLNILKNKNLDKIDLKDLLNINKRKEILKSHRVYNEYFEEYLKFGGFLYRTSPDLQEFYLSLDNVTKKIIYADLGILKSLNPKIEEDAKNILILLATTAPFETSYTKVSNNMINISKNTVISLIGDLEKTGLIKQLKSCNSGYALIRTESKIFLNLPFRYFFNYTMGKTPNIGSLREDFFVYSASPDCYVKTGKAKSADFMINNKLYEIGGESKKNNQNADYLVVDSLACENNKIPLFLFG
ncbi:MAG: AAA family ATPase, partial [archaeon]